ncbi:MAG: bifunctional [glutamine synthetase] adenylyltransferase/[glutamine synthetase]-adenylyl-L-tyrosine phosphorylase [Rhizobiaceae bacterium]
MLAPLDADRAAGERAELAVLAREAGLSRLAALVGSDGPLATFLAAALDLSPYVRDTVRRRPALLEALFDQPLDERLQALHAEIETLWRAENEAAIMDAMRELKREAHCLIALADLSKTATPADTVERMSALADVCIRSAVRFALASCHRRGKLALPDPETPDTDCGLIVLAMGKLGARELNFSSDIDLVVFFDPEAPAIIDPVEAVDLFVRVTRQLVRILNDRTTHGYVFRTDLRLRPDPGSTPLAIPVMAALTYYESRGQNWERAAMIKARPVAGDIPAGEAFLSELKPYVWRKYMDFAAIADVHAIKRQIHAHKGHGEVAVRGHNVKLGRGGIREIEFFVQTQQLIAGGRFPELRGRSTIAMLDMLAARGWIGMEASKALADQYWFLRAVEHAVQMVADEQAHNLPDDEHELLRIALMLGFADVAAFSVAFRRSLKTVEAHYAALFEAEAGASAVAGNLVFTGDVDDPATLETLSQLGFTRPSDICRVIRSWHFGRYRATQSAISRERLTELTPVLLETFGRTRRADEALMRFDTFLSGLPAGIQLFSLLQTNPALLDLLATIMAAAPRLAGTITRRPHVFDGLLDPGLMSELPDHAYLDARLTAFLEGAVVYEDILDRLRIFNAEQKFLIGIRLLTGAIDAAHAGAAFSDLADLTIAVALDAVIDEFALRHGRVPGGEVAIVAMGKLGSRELTAGSDIDLILLYNHDAEALESDGQKPLDPSQYFARLTQRLIAAVSAPTAEGVLYELDLRLRPSGNKGPVATHIEAFRKYQREHAWVWEQMALTRARMIAGDPALIELAETEIAKVLAADHDIGKVLHEAREMRALIETEKPPASIWDVKLIPGGLIDLEFIAQTAALTGRLEAGGERTTSTARNLGRLAETVALPQLREELVAAHRLYSTLTQIARLCIDGEIDPDDIPPGLADLLLRSTDLPDLSILAAHIEETSRRVRSHFDTLLRGEDRS